MTSVVHALNDAHQVSGVSTLSVPFKRANALSVPPGEYDRKIKTQRNRRGIAQAVEHAVQFDNERRTLPGLKY